MKLKELEWALQEVESFKDPKVGLEQYPTSAHLAARIVYNAEFMFGDIEDKKVLDLGCGPGIFAVASKILGSAYTLGIDIDDDALQIAVQNRDEFELEIDFLQKNIVNLNLLGSNDGGCGEYLAGSFDTVLMNPPFGTKPGNKGIDMLFLEKALSLVGNDGAVYSIHKSSTRKHIGKKANSFGANMEVLAEMKFDIGKMYKFL